MHGRSNKRGKDDDADAESRFEWGGGAKAEKRDDKRDDSHLLPPPEEGDDKEGKKKKKKPVFEPSGLLREAALTTEGGVGKAVRMLGGPCSRALGACMNVVVPFAY